MTSTALKNLSQLLRTEDDLDKVPTLKTQLQTEKSTFEVQLKSMTQSQMDRLVQDMETLAVCQDEVRALKEGIDRVNGLAEESGAMKRFEIINDMSRVHEMFEQSVDIAENIGSFSEQLSEVEEMMDQGQDLLVVHYHLNQVRDFQDQILELSERSSDDGRFTVKKITARTDSVVRKFDTLLGDLIGDLVEIVKEEDYTLVVKVAKIIEFEEKQDQKIETLKQVLRAKSKSHKEYPGLFEQIVNGTIQGRTKPRHYKQFFLDRIAESIKEIYKNCWETYDASENVFDILGDEGLQWVFNDLACVKQELTKLVPPKWDIYKVYYDVYYEELHQLMVRLIEKEPEMLIILDILDFDNHFQDVMKRDIGMKEIKTCIGEMEKEKLLDDYLNLLVMKMKEWMGNLEKTECEVFKSRLQAPDSDSENMLALEGTKIVFQMFTQQCDAAAGSGQGKILAGVVREFGELLIKRQGVWGQLVKVEVQRWLVSNNAHGADDVEEVPAGLIEYLTALANDQMRGADYTEAISKKYGGMVSQKYGKQIHQDLERVIEGFADLAKQCCDGLIVIIFDDLKTVMDLIFTKDWGTSNYTQSISDTLLEYLGDLKMTMNIYLFEILAEEILEECILRYLNNLNHDIKFPKTTDKLLTCVKRDFEVFYKLFIQFLDGGIIESKFKIVENFMDLATEPDIDQIVAHWRSTVQKFPDLKPEFLSLIIKARRDLDSSDAKLILPRARQEQKDYIAANEMSIQATFMGRFTLTTKLKKDYL